MTLSNTSRESETAPWNLKILLKNSNIYQKQNQKLYPFFTPTISETKPNSNWTSKGRKRKKKTSNSWVDSASSSGGEVETVEALMLMLFRL